MKSKQTDLNQLKSVMYKNLEMVFANLELEVEQDGGSYIGCCPIHDDSDNPSAFTYSVEKNMWKCWTHECHSDYSCDIFGLIRGVLSKKQGKEVSFGETLGWCFRVLNLDTRDIDTVEIHKEAPDSFFGLVDKFYKPTDEVADEPGREWETQVPSEYFVYRGFEPATIDHFGVGDCKVNGLMKYRAVIPIHNKDGTVQVGAIGRSTLDYIDPKFVIEPGFNKRNYFYNHHRAIEKIRETNCAFLSEGQGNVWRLHECGVFNAISMLGKELSPRHETLLDEMGITTLVVLTDHDQPGREAKIKIQRKYDRMFRLIFPKVPTRRDVAQMAPDKIKSTILKDLRGLY